MAKTRKAKEEPQLSKEGQERLAEILNEPSPAPAEAMEQLMALPPLPRDDEKKKKHPESIKLAAPYGFIDEAGEHKYWNQGQVVTDPEQIELLIKRGAFLDE